MRHIKVTLKQNHTDLIYDLKSQSFRKPTPRKTQSSIKVMGIHSPAKHTISFCTDCILSCKIALHFLEVGLRQWDLLPFRTAAAAQFQFPSFLSETAGNNPQPFSSSKVVYKSIHKIELKYGSAK